MNLKETNKTETNLYELDIEVTPEEFNKAVNSVYKNEVKKMNIPGFRQGKAPRAFAEKYYGAEVFFEAAVDHMYRDLVQEAIEESKLEVVAVKDFAIDEIGKEIGMKCKLKVVVYPEVEIDGYKGIAINKSIAVATDDDIEAEIQKVRERNSRLIRVEDRAVENGDIVDLDFEGLVDGVAFEGGKAEHQELTIGANQFIPGFEEKLIGHNPDESFDIEVKFPEDYQAEELKGKDAIFKIKLHEIKMKELPDVDDEFVKDISEFDTLDEYKKDAEKNLIESKQKELDNAFENQLIDEINTKLEGEIPAEMIDSEVDEILNQFAYRLQSQGMDMKTYMLYTGMTQETMGEQYRPQAERQVKIRLALEKISSIEGIEISDEEFATEMEDIAKMYEMEVDKIKGLVSEETVKADIKNRKAIELVKEHIVEKPEGTDEKDESAE